MLEVTVCIASIGRPSLGRAIRSAVESGRRAELEFDIVVVDDSKDRSASALLERDGPWHREISCFELGSGNAAKARNLCVHQAEGPYIAFIDDDEVADIGWLEGLVSAAREFDADVVFGPVDRVLAEETPDWIKDAIPRRKPEAKRGERVKVGATGNCLIKKAALTSRDLWFKPAFGRTGGEGADLFTRLGEAGGMMIATDEAVVTETVPAGRLTIWYLRRSYCRSGYTYALIRLRSLNVVLQGMLSLVCAVKWLGATLIMTFMPRATSLWLRWAIRSWRYRGYILAIMGRSVPELDERRGEPA